MATGDAPAFAAEVVELEAQVAWADGSGSARAAFPAMALYALALDVSTPRVEVEARPGERVAFRVDVENRGNGPTRVQFEAQVEENRLQAL